MYLCGALADVTEGQSSECVGTVGTTLDECRRGAVLGGWAVGGGVSVQLSTNEYNPVLLHILFLLIPFRVSYGILRLCVCVGGGGGGGRDPCMQITRVPLPF